MEYNYEYAKVIANNEIKDDIIVNAYAYETYFIINNSIRKKRISQTIYNAILHLVNLIDTMPGLPNDTIVYRALNNECYDDLECDSVIVDEAFTSFTISESMVKSLAYNAYMESILPAGTKYIYIPQEKEILTYPGIQYTVEEIQNVTICKKNIPKYYCNLQSVYDLNSLQSYIDYELDTKYTGTLHIDSSDYYHYIVQELELEEFL